MTGGGAHPANPERGEVSLICKGEVLKLRPSFAALVAAEQELGSLFALVERAAQGALRLEELAALFWHCRYGAPQAISREDMGEAIVAQGLAKTTPVLRALLQQILAGQS